MRCLIAHRRMISLFRMQDYDCINDEAGLAGFVESSGLDDGTDHCKIAA